MKLNLPRFNMFVHSACCMKHWYLSNPSTENQALICLGNDISISVNAVRSMLAKAPENLRQSSTRKASTSTVQRSLMCGV